ncbi:MAG: hypothetical protein A2512_13515 [Deltaproteobacteria bacterium RIFOXYD12_FULL_56_24]|nr:MAG: hypothetical protein A2512_13515 [Deltaproteobacteria bacterium RIFOXYD12_FULL_56_24]
MMPWFSNGPFFHGFGGLFMILFWVMLLLVCISLVRKGGSREKETAEEILKKRYARGEISQEEFVRMKKEIME